MYLIKTNNGELYHHGILGQKWGKRQGPPYPLDASDHSASEKKAGWRKSLNDATTKLAKANMSAYISKRDAKRARRAGRIDRKEYKERIRDAKKRQNEQTWEVLTSGSRNRRLSKLNKSAEKKLSKTEKQYEKLMATREKNREKILKKGNNDLLKSFDSGTKSIDSAYKRYWDTYSNMANEKAKTLLDPSNKKSSTYQKAAEDYSKQHWDSLLYGNKGVILKYAMEDYNKKGGV